jgi:hypothetical protein
MKQAFYILTLTFFTVSSCNQTKQFDSKEWKTSLDGTYPHRHEMIESLLNDSTMLEKEKPELLKILGQPNFKGRDSLNRKTFHYDIQIAYGWNIDPLYYSYLFIAFDPETNQVEKIEVIESEDRRSFIEKITTGKY